MASGETIRELVMIPASLARFVPVPGEPRAFVPIEYLIELFGDLLFPGFAIRSLGVFRIIRDSDIELEEEAERSEEHTSELQSLMRISYAVFCLKKKIK